MRDRTLGRAGVRGDQGEPESLGEELQSGLAVAVDQRRPDADHDLVLSSCSYPRLCARQPGGRLERLGAPRSSTAAASTPRSSATPGSDAPDRRTRDRPTRSASRVRRPRLEPPDRLLEPQHPGSDLRRQPVLRGEPLRQMPPAPADLRSQLLYADAAGRLAQSPPGPADLGARLSGAGSSASASSSSFSTMSKRSIPVCASRSRSPSYVCRAAEHVVERPRTVDASSPGGRPSRARAAAGVSASWMPDRLGDVADMHGGRVQPADDGVELLRPATRPGDAQRLVQGDHERQVLRGQAAMQLGRLTGYAYPVRSRRRTGAGRGAPAA